MIKEFRHHIGVKLFILLTMLVFLSMVPLAYVVFSTVSYFGNYTVDLNRDEIKSQAATFLATIAREQSHKYDAFFSHVEVAASLMAAQAGEIYDNLDHYAGFPDVRHQLATKEQSEEGQLGDPQVYTTYLEGEQLPVVEMSEMQALLRLDPVFKAVQKEFPESSGINMLTVTGICRYLNRKENGWGPYPESIVKNTYGQRLKNALSFFYNDPGALESDTIKVQVYRDTQNSDLFVSVSSPIIDKHEQLRGVISIDLPVREIMAESFGAEANRLRGQVREVLFSFLIDSGGRIISFPTEYFDLFGISTVGNETGDDVYDFRLTDSTVAAIPPVVETILESDSESVEVALESGTYNCISHTLHRLNWHLVLVTREADTIGSEKSTKEALSVTIELLIRKFVVNALVLTFILLLVVFVAVGYFVAPLKKLSDAALRVGRGDLQTRCDLDREDELGILAESFNDMVQQLENAEKVTRNQAQQLELTVQERTRDLREKNFVLRDVIGELNTESERRRRAVEAMKRSEQQIHTVMEASLAGHGIVQEGKIKYVNAMGLRIFGYSREEMLSGSFEVADLIVSVPYERAQKKLMEGFSADVQKPYVLEFKRKDGSCFDALVGGAVTTWEGTAAIVATIMDISEQKQAEEELLQSKHLLQESLVEKEVLLREIYHRTKNNMLVIISMLHLQAMDIEDEKVKTLFWETENRIRAMSLVHEKLYQSQNLAEIELGSYLRDMVTALIASMVVGDTVKFTLESEPVTISIDNIVPLGLAINEIVTNSLKHAFPNQSDCQIYIHISPFENGTVEVLVGDNGVGFPTGMDLNTIRSFGMQITASLIRRQLHGSMAIERENGTVYRIRFSEPVRPKRV